MNSDEQKRGDRRGCFAQFKLVMIIVGAIALSVIGWLTFGLIADNLRKSPEVSQKMSALALACIRHRAWLPVVCLPPMVMAIVALRAGISTRKRWILFIAAQVWLFVVLALILYSFIASLAPLYEFQPLD